MKQMNSFFRMSSLAVAALAITASCSNEELDGVNGLSKANTFITATFEQPGGGINTRTTLGVNNEVLWQPGDQFKLFYGSSVSAVFKTEGSGESATFGANITGDISGATYAIFPIMTGVVDVTLNNTVATTTLRKEIPFSEATNGPMWADASADLTNLSFKHLAGLLKLTVSGLPTGKELVLKVTADKNIAGTATVELNPGSGEPYLEVSDEDQASEVYKDIIVTGVHASNEGATVFYVPLPVKTLGELKVNIYDSSDTNYENPLYKEKKWTNIAVARAMIRSASFGFEVVDLSATDAKTITEAINGAVPSGDASSATTTTVEIKGSVDATSDTDRNATIQVPAEANKNVALDFGTAPKTSAEKPLKITEATSSGSGSGSGTTPAEDSKNTITVTMPAATNAVAAVTIETPQSTVELTSPSETESNKTKYTTITATTANNTLVVGKNVEIETINVKGGNIRLKNGSKVTTITRDNSYTGKLYIYKEKGASYDGRSAGNVEVVEDVQDANLETVLAKGGTYILPADIILTKPLVVSGKDVTIDLNGYTIKATSLIAPAGMTSDDALVIVRRGAKLTINDTKGTGSIDGTKCPGDHCAVKLTDSADQSEKGTATLVVHGGTLKGLQAGISGNGNRHDTSITINGGHILSQEQASSSTDGVGIYHPQDGTLTINGGTIEGYQSGVEIRSGKLEMTGGTLKSWATSYTEAANGSGTTMSGTALAVSQHTTEKDITVNITGGFFEGVYALSEKDLQNPTGTVTLSVTGGTFKGKVASVHGSDGFIKGGNFNDVSAVNYVAEGGNINVTLDADASMETFKLSANKTATINLNNKTLNLTSKDYNSVIYGTAVFKNGTITVADDAKANHTIFGLEGCNITLDGVTLNGGYYAMLVQGLQAKVEVKNHSTINAKYFTFSTNATGSDDGKPDWGYDATITLKDSKFIAEETGFMNNVPATVTIENCEFEGNHQAALLRGGKYTIKNSTFTLKATLPDSNSENKHFKKDGVTKWGEGNQCAFAGITIGNYGGNSYQYETTVDMTGVTVKVKDTYASAFPALHACANSADGKGVTITYDNASLFTASGYNPAIEYGTTNIQVNGKAVTEVNGSYVVSTAE